MLTQEFEILPSLALLVIWETVEPNPELNAKDWWWARRESNPRPIGYEPTALTPELRALDVATA